MVIKGHHFETATIGCTMGSGHSSRNESYDATGKVNFDHFQILRAIGKGSFGKVCIVQKKDSKKMYAMKYMNKTACAKQEAISNVVREVDILKKVDHVFIVNLWYCFQDEEDMFMVVDLLLGGDLRYHMQEDVSFTEAHLRLYLVELSLALDYLQSTYIMHRDIKPDNILLDEEGHVHITDFNIASDLRPGELATSLSGTKPYMAPEVFSTALGDCDGYGFPVDWWALGVTAYELLKKRRPFNIHGDSTAKQTWNTIYNTKVHFISGLSDAMNDLIRQLLDVDPKHRLRSAESVRSHPAMASISFEEVRNKTVKPLFVPSKDHLNCDPTYELEEMIIETKPLHKKKKRLAKQLSKKESISSTENVNHAADETEDQFKAFRYYNRYRHRDGKDQSEESETSEDEGKDSVDPKIDGTSTPKPQDSLQTESAKATGDSEIRKS